MTKLNKKLNSERQTLKPQNAKGEIAVAFSRGLYNLIKLLLLEIGIICTTNNFKPIIINR